MSRCWLLVGAGYISPRFSPSSRAASWSRARRSTKRRGAARPPAGLSWDGAALSDRQAPEPLMSSRVSAWVSLRATMSRCDAGRIFSVTGWRRWTISDLSPPPRMWPWGGIPQMKMEVLPRGAAARRFAFGSTSPRPGSGSRCSLQMRAADLRSSWRRPTTSPAGSSRRSPPRLPGSASVRPN